jgi:molybdopterin-guanine dinucleotide biosynthesis protein A
VLRKTASMTASRPRLAAVVLAGGTAVRLGGADKATLEIGGRTLLEIALAATARAEETVVVGLPVPVDRPVTWTREAPPCGGPAAGVLAGLDALTAPPDLVCVLAVDMPRFTGHTLGRLVDTLVASPDAEATCLVDEAGRQQWLAGVYRYAALAGARPARREAGHGLSVRRMLAPLRVVGVRAVADEARDVDTWTDLRDLRDS